MTPLMRRILSAIDVRDGVEETGLYTLFPDEEYFDIMVSLDRLVLDGWIKYEDNIIKRTTQELWTQLTISGL